MIKVKRDGQEMSFDDPTELLVFAVENMTFKSELEDVRQELKADINNVRTELKADIIKLDHDLRAHIDSKIEDVKIHTATLLKNKEIITKQEGIEYIRGTV